MTERGMRFRIGVFVLAALILLAVLITLFGSLPGMFKRHDVYFVRFQDATGIGPGTPVRRSGVRIGEVQDLELDDETGEVRVRIFVGKQFTIRHDEQAVLIQGILGGDTTLDFVRKRPDGEPLDHSPVQPGEELVGIRQSNINTLVAQAAEIVPTTQEALNEIRKSLRTFEKMTPQMDEAIREYRDLARETRRMVPDVRRTNDEIQLAARNWGRVGERVD